jgi:nitrite reductase/ring-hydroxylating ferredoxin subunit
MRHSPQIELATARNELLAARDECPHWGFESESEETHECCYRVDDARRRYRTAKRRVQQ